MKAMLIKLVGVALLVGAVYLARVRLPAAYPAAVKATGVAVVSREAMDRLAAVYLATGAAGGFGLGLILWPWAGRRGRG